MELRKIANILYNMALDMDYSDGIEFADEEIRIIATELQVLVDNNCDSLFSVLENIAMGNKNMKDWCKKLRG